MIGDEAWDVDYYYHENPELKRQPFVFLTDFVGCLPMEEATSARRTCAPTATPTTSSTWRAIPYVRDAAIFVGNPDDVTEQPFGPGPAAASATGPTATSRIAGYTLPFDPRALADTERAARSATAIAATRSSSSPRSAAPRSARPLLRQDRAGLPAHEAAGAGAAHDPRRRPAAVARRRSRSMTGLEVRPYVHNLFEHLACCDLALVQGGLSTCMELVATRRPFLSFPLRAPLRAVRPRPNRLHNYGADRAVRFRELTTRGARRARARRRCTRRSLQAGRDRRRGARGARNHRRDGEPIVGDCVTGASPSSATPAGNADAKPCRVATASPDLSRPTSRRIATGHSPGAISADRHCREHHVSRTSLVARPSATPSASRCPSASAGTSTATSSAAAASTSPRSSCPTACRRSTQLTFLSADEQRFCSPGPGPHLRQHVRPGRALHRRQDARGQPRPLARRPGRARGAGALHRRGAQAPGAVPPHRGA